MPMVSTRVAATATFRPNFGLAGLAEQRSGSILEYSIGALVNRFSPKTDEKSTHYMPLKARPERNCGLEMRTSSIP
jgi:hypothetical protein